VEGCFDELFTSSIDSSGCESNDVYIGEEPDRGGERSRWAGGRLAKFLFYFRKGV